MNAAETIRVAEESGIRLEIADTDLILDADLEPPVDVVDAIRRHKAEIIELLAPTGDRWTAEEWRAFFDERAGIAEFDGGRTRAEAEAIAFESCVVEWLNRHRVQSDPDRCAWCEKPDPDGHAVIPFGTESHGHIWLHPECWPNWFEHRQQQAAKALASMGIRPAARPNGKTD